MKIALITIHYANSYGGTLQALASQSLLSKYGEVALIDYKCGDLKKTLDLLRVGSSPRDLLRIGKDIVRVLPRRRLVKKFKSFIHEYYNLTEECSTGEQLMRLVKDFDVFVCGSDQIWNPCIVGGFDTNYMLSFVQGKRKLSFSSSSGSYLFNEKEQELVKSALADFSSISLREEDSVRRMKSLLQREDVSHTIDPTLMLGKDEWLKLLDIQAARPEQDYIFVYTLKKSDLVRQTVDRVAKHLGMRVIAIDQDPFLGYRADRHIMDASPLDYVELIANASFVVTNSFHGTAFAVNFEVPFVTVSPESGLNRVQGFLDKVGLSSRLVLRHEDIDKTIEGQCSFGASRQALESLKAETQNYLDKAFCRG